MKTFICRECGGCGRTKVRNLRKENYNGSGFMIEISCPSCAGTGLRERDSLDED